MHDDVYYNIGDDMEGQKLDDGAYLWNSKSRMVFYKNPNEQENEMEELSTKVFEYCIIDWDAAGNSVVITGPSLITIDAKETHANLALVRIGQLHNAVITKTSEVQLRPFC